MGDFNCPLSQTELASFLSDNNLHSLINTPTCFKSYEGSCIDLILTNKKHSFQKSQSFETGISEYHHMIYTMLKQSFVKLPPKVVTYRSYRNFSLEVFKAELCLNLNHSQPGSFSSFNSALEATLDKHAPQKKHIIRGNNKPHISKTLRKAIMVRSKLKNIYNHSRNISDLRKYKKQRNYVADLNKQEKKKFLRNASTNSDEKNF